MKNQGDFDRRKSERIETALPCRLSYASGSREIRAETLDLSMGGQCLLLNEMLPPEVKHVQAQLEKNGVQLTAECAVVWRDAEQKKIGLRFKENYPETFKLIEQVQGGSESAGLPSFQDNRREFRKLAQSMVTLENGIIRRKQQAIVLNYSTAGLSLVGNLKGISLNSKASIRILGNNVSGNFTINCRWFYKIGPGMKKSGWVVSQEDRENFLEAMKDIPYDKIMPESPDRRGWKRNINSFCRKRFSDQSRISPLQFFEEDMLFKRKSNSNFEKINKRKNIGRTEYKDRKFINEKPVSTTLFKMFSALRDFFILIFPASFSVKLIPQGEFAFLTHPRDVRDIQRQFPLFKFLPENLIKIWLKYQWPVIGERINGIQDRYGKEVKGWLIFCPLTAKQMIQNREFAKKRVLLTIKLASKMGIKNIGLGAFTSIVTRDGLDARDRYPLNVTTGNALSAAGAVQNVAAAAHILGVTIENSTIGIVGAAGNVGSACAKIFAQKKVKKLILVDINQKKLFSLYEEISKMGLDVQMATTPDSIITAEIVIAVTNAPGAVVKEEHLKSGAIVVDAAQPKNVSDKVPQIRKDVLVIESSVYRYPGINYNFDLDIAGNEALGCMAETIVLSAAGRQKDYSIGQLTVDHVLDIYSAARFLGVKIGYFRSSQGWEDEESLRRIREQLKN